LSSSNGIKVAGPFPNSPSQFEKRYSARTNVTTSHTFILKEGSEPKIGRKLGQKPTIRKPQHSNTKLSRAP